MTHEPTFTLMLNHTSNLTEPTLNDVAVVSNALLNTLGETWADALRRDLDAARYHRRHRMHHALPEHALFWRPGDCQYVLDNVLRLYSVTPENAERHVSSTWALPNDAALVLLSPNDAQRRLYFRRGDAQILVAHAYASGNRKTPYSTAICDTTERWLRDTVGILKFDRSDWFSTSMSHAKTLESCESRLIEIAERIKKILDKHAATATDSALV